MRAISPRDVEQTFDVFMNAWNNGDLEQACQIYAKDASFIGKAGYVHGRDNILERYRQAYPDKASMGELKLELVEFRLAPTTGHMATVILRWKVTKENGEEMKGYALETYEFQRDGLRLVQDATV